jgi:thymidine kinase
MDDRLEVICGCMFSGKTTALIERVAELQAEGRQVLCLKPAVDDRYSRTDIVTHDGARLPASAVRSCHEVLAQADAAAAEVVALDEVHFFSDELVAVVGQLRGRGVRVLCCGLDRDMWGDEFDHVRRLAEAGSCRRMLGTCAVCGRPADRTQRKTPLRGGRIVGGTDAFESRCAACFRPPLEPKSAISMPGIA